MDNHIFRSAIGGFNRQDVMEYIERTQKQSEESIAWLESQTAQLQASEEEAQNALRECTQERDRLAAELGNPKVLNMVVLGALLKKRPLVEQEDVVRAMEHVWGEARAKKLVPLNLKAIAAGSAAAE